MSNPDQESEHNLIGQLVPDLDKDLILRLIGAFHDLRKGYENGVLTYPYSLWGSFSGWSRKQSLGTKLFAELINLVRHMKAYPADTLGDALQNIFDFDIYKSETIDKLSKILIHHG